MQKARQGVRGNGNSGIHVTIRKTCRSLAKA